MPTYPLLQVDAFTDRPLGGNPCAVLFDADEMTAETMLAVAREMNLSETAFVRCSAVADFGVRFFTPAEEIPLAGHPTIATAFALIATGRFPLTGDRTHLTLELQVGPIQVDIEARGARVEQIMMTQKKPAFLETYPAAQVLSLFGLSPEDALPGAPVQVVSTGTPQLMVPVGSLEVLRRIQLDIPAYSEFRRQAGFFSPHLFCLGGVTPRGSTFARHFGVPPDTTEDPFTGSATGGMAAYLWRYGLVDRPTLLAEQGHWLGRAGQAQVEVVGSRQDIETVRVGGSAVAVMRGELTI